MTISNFDGARKVKWSRPRGGVVPPVWHDYINQIIEQKNNKWAHYDSSCTEYWLLMIKNDNDYSMSIVIEQDVLDHEYQSNFDRLFIFDIGTLELNELLSE